MILQGLFLDMNLLVILAFGVLLFLREEAPDHPLAEALGEREPDLRAAFVGSGTTPSQGQLDVSAALEKDWPHVLHGARVHSAQAPLSSAQLNPCDAALHIRRRHTPRDAREKRRHRRT